MKMSSTWTALFSIGLFFAVALGATIDPCLPADSPYRVDKKLLDLAEKRENVVVHTGGWDSQYIQNMVIEIILRESLGLRTAQWPSSIAEYWGELSAVQTKHKFESYRTAVFEGFRSDYGLDVAMEQWPEMGGVTVTPYVYEDKVIIKAGDDGVSGVSMWLTNMPTGSVHDQDFLNQFICSTCNQSTIPTIYTSVPGYMISKHSKAVIDNLGLNIFMNSTGTEASLSQIVKDHEQQGKPILFVGYTPSLLRTSDYNRVHLPDNPCLCAEAKCFYEDQTCDFGRDVLEKMVSPRLREISEEAYYLIGQFQLSNVWIDDMLQDVVNGSSHQEAACRWVKENVETWYPWIPKHQVFEEPTALTYGFVVFALMLAVSSLAMVIVKKKSRIIKAASLHFSTVFLVGTLIRLCHYWLIVGVTVENWNCVTALFMQHLGLTIASTGLYAKVSIMLNIFGGHKGSSLSVKKNVRSQLGLRIAAWTAVIVIFLIIWISVADYGVVIEKSGFDYHAVCKSNNYVAWDLGISVLEFMVLFTTCYVCATAKHLPEQFNESVIITASVYTYFGTMVISKAMDMIGGETAYYARFLSMTGDIIAILLMFLPKAISIAQGHDNTSVVTSIAPSSMGSRKVSTASVVPTTSETAEVKPKSNNLRIDESLLASAKNQA